MGWILYSTTNGTELLIRRDTEGERGVALVKELRYLRAGEGGIETKANIKCVYRRREECEEGRDRIFGEFFLKFLRCGIDVRHTHTISMVDIQKKIYYVFLHKLTHTQTQAHKQKHKQFSARIPKHGKAPSHQPN